MKKILMIFSALLSASMMWAQSLYVYQGDVVATANVGKDIQIEGQALQIEGVTFLSASIDSIVFKEGSVQEDSIVVKYNGAKAQVFIPACLMQGVDVNVNGAYVSVNATEHDMKAASEFAEELKYVLMGKSDDGSFYLEGVYKSTLYLNGVELTSKQGAAINIQNGKRIDVIVPQGTVNSLTDAATSGEVDVQKACFRVKGHAEFKGAGTLNIAGKASHAFKSNEYTILKKTFTGVLNITAAVKDAMHVGQFFEMSNGTVNITNPGADGIQTEITATEADTLNGQIYIKGGVLNITCSSNEARGIRADSLCAIMGGKVNITMNGNNSDGILAHTGQIGDADNSSLRPEITIVQNGGYLEKEEGGEIVKKKSACYKTASDAIFYAGTINVTYDDSKAKKAKGIIIGGNLSYSKTNFKWNDIPDVVGFMKYF